MKRGAGGILLKEGKILLGKRASNRKHYPNVWDIIGGHCLPGEELPDTLVRELREEINVTPKAFKYLNVLHELQPELYGEREYHIYLVTGWIGKDPIVLGGEHSEIGWFSIEEAIRLDLAHPGYTEIFKTIKQ
ncbi:MAG: NUDIX hydrolase [Desulfobacteraceae bacterium]|nr:NUDIX hydrolase [Desulfobacteraceae bacterium]